MMTTTAPLFIMLIGVPGAGKSFYIKNILHQDFKVSDNAVILSTDDKIEAAALAEGKTYNDVFKYTISIAEKQMYADATDAFAAGRNVIWDQTSVSKKKRLRSLAKFPGYKKIGYCILPPDTITERDELNRRLNSRLGKTIPIFVIDSMIKSFEIPSIEEGFDEIYIVDMFGNLRLQLSK